jgi:hypothetical protein
MKAIEGQLPKLAYHIWVKRYTQAVERAVVQSLSGSEIAIKMDFASQMEMQAAQRVTCSQPCTCNLLVLTVMSASVDGTRTVDYWRTWSNAKKILSWCGSS